MEISTGGQTCDGQTDVSGRCDPSHPIHCCHFMRTTWERYPKIAGVCAKCGKTQGRDVNRVTGKTKLLPLMMKEWSDGGKSHPL